MKFEFASIFEKDLKKIRENRVLISFQNILTNLKKAESIFEIEGVRKMVGAKNAYRIRINEYRVGFYLINNIIQFKRFLNRKDIYKYFP